MTVRYLLKKHNALTKEISRIDYHMDLLNVSVNSLKRVIPELNGKTEEELVTAIEAIYRKCDSASPIYDSELDQQMVRLGLRTDKFPQSYPGKNIYGSLDSAPEQGIGDEMTSVYDDYVDSDNDRMHR